MASRIKEFFSSKDDLDYPDNYQQQYRAFAGRNGHSTALPVLELKVPMCCEKCQEKVKEALEECEGVKDVVCDQYNQRVTVTGFVDPLKALRRVKKVKKKSEFFNSSTYIKRTSHPIDRNDIAHNGITTQTRYTTNPLIRTSSSGFGRFPHEGKMAAMGPLAVVQPQPRLARQPVYYRGDDRLPQGGGHHNRLLPVPMDLRRDFHGIRRMPSFKNYRYHDAEYISMGDEFRPSVSDTRYVSYYNQRPAALRSQVSFSRIPVTNPHYLKHIESEYY